MTVTAIQIAALVASRVKDSGQQVVDSTVEAMAADENTRRGNALRTAFIKRKLLVTGLDAIKPDERYYADGAEATGLFTEAQQKDREKYQAALRLVDNALAKLPDDWTGLLALEAELCKLSPSSVFIGYPSPDPWSSAYAPKNLCYGNVPSGK